MQNLITTGNTLTMSSREIAELVGSRTSSVNLSIARLLARGVISVERTVFSAPEIRGGTITLGRAAKAYGIHRSSLYEAVERGRIPTRLNAKGQKEVALADMDEVYGSPDTVAPMVPSVGRGSVSEYLLSKRDSLVVVAQLCPEFTARIVDRWQELESRQAVALPSYAETLRLYADQIEATQRVTAERDEAIATKAQIGSKREATAMAAASAAARKVRALQDQLGINQRHATVIAVERSTGRSLARNTYVELRRWCKANDQTPVEVVDARYGTVKAWPAGAWMAVHGIDLSALFSSSKEAA